MKEYKAAQRYANAILQIAEEQKQIERITSDFALLDNIVRTSRDIQLFLESPVINTLKKKKIILALFESKVSDITLKLLLLLVEKNREMLIPAIIFHFNNMLDERRGIVNAEVTTAALFDDNQIERLAKRLESLVKKKVRIKFKTDPSIIGGFKVRIDDRVWDGTILHQFEILKNQFTKAGVQTKSVKTSGSKKI